MREVIYRGKALCGKWVEGLPYEVDGVIDCIRVKEQIQDIISYTTYKIIPESISEFTGLTDKNGKKIFEGDIVKFAKHLYQIIFECGSFALLDKQGEMISKIGGINDHCYSLMNLYLECCWEDDCAYDIEVIGNIHDNSDLLKGGAE